MADNDKAHYTNSRNLIADITKSQTYRDQIVHIEEIPQRDAKYAELENPLPPLLQSSLQGCGITQLYSHQATALRLTRDAKNIVVSTSTASGKTLCYNLPVLELLEVDENSKALYLFPTKALAQDQLRRINELGLPYAKAYAYDGDTPRKERPFIKSIANIILTNPDMLHCGILPAHASWASFFRNLKYVVIDELHSYKGVFGTHVALIMRRLRIVASSYGSNPIFICSSATLSNPVSHAQEITGVSVEAIDYDGSPNRKKTVVFWNPPFLDLRGERQSANVETVELFTRLIRRKCRTLVFAKARKTAEIILRHTKRRLDISAKGLSEKIASYRGGYRPEERRAIENKLFTGDLLGVASTSALELGVDIGTLDAVIMCGYPGTVSSTMQQIGRAGREKQESFAFLLARDDPMDQFIMRSPNYLFSVSYEKTIVNLSNPYILGPQLACAIAEMPLTSAQIAEYFGESAWGVLGELYRTGVIEYSKYWYWRGVAAPSLDVNIRSSGGSSYSIIAVEDKAYELGTVDANSVFQMLHPGAVYLHAGESYVVNKLDNGNKHVYVEKSTVDYYTSAGESIRINIVSKELTTRLKYADLHYGDVHVISQVTHYWRKKLFTERMIARVPLNLPETSLETKGVWIELNKSINDELNEAGADVMGSLHACEHLLIGVLPLLTICDRIDIGGVSVPTHTDCQERSAIFIYDGYSGGVGIAENAYHSLNSWLQMALEILGNCRCSDGCPGCVHSPKCGSDNQPLDKAGAKLIISRLLT